MGELSSNLLLSNAPWLLGSGKPERPCERMQRAHLTSATILWAVSAGDCCPPPGNNGRHVRLAAANTGLLRFRSLPGPPLIWNATPPPAGVVGSGKSATPWL